MKVVLVCDSVFPENKGGVERWFGFLARELVRSGDEVTYLNAAQVDGVRDGVKFVSVLDAKWQYQGDGVRSIKQSLRFAIEIGRWLKSNEFDFIYCSQAPIFPVFTAGVIAKLKRKVLFVEWIEIWRMRYWQKYLGLFAGIIGWLTQFAALQFGNLKLCFNGRTMQRAQALTIFKKSSIESLNGLVDSSIELPLVSEKNRDGMLFLGRLVSEKQPILALRVFEALCDQGWRKPFHIVGQGPLLAEMSAAKANSKYGTLVHIHSEASDEVVRDLLSQCFLLIHPTRREGYGLVVVEAAQSGVPTLLIDGADNLATDLAISPSLVCSDASVLGLAEKVRYAFAEQSELRKELALWLSANRASRSMRSSVQQIRSYAAELLH